MANSKLTMSKEQYHTPELEDLVVSLEVAKLAHQKGYPGIRTKDIWYRMPNKKTFTCAPRSVLFPKGARGDKRFEGMAEYYPASNKETMQRWLRTEHKIHTGSSNPALMRGLEQLPDVNPV